MRILLLCVLLAGCGASPVPESALLRVDEAARLLEEGRLDDAEATFRLALELHPLTPAAHAGLGVVALLRDDLVAAEAHLRDAVEIDEDFAIAWSNRGVVAERRGDLEHARAYYEHALSILPLMPEPRRNLVVMLLRRGHAEEARAHAMRLVQVTDDAAQDVPLLALCELALDRPEQASARLATLDEGDRDTPVVRALRALVGDATHASGEVSAARPDRDPSRRAAP